MEKGTLTVPLLNHFIERRWLLAVKMCTVKVKLKVRIPVFWAHYFPRT
jgi:hypothetical protein